MIRRLRSRPAAFYRRLLALTLPIALQNLITFSLGLIDTFMVSQLGNTEMAAVTAANGPVFLLLSMVFGIQSGLGILASQYWGKRDTENINRALGVASFLGAGLAVILALAFFLRPVAIMDLLSNLWATGDTQRVAEGVLAADFIWHENLNETVPGLTALVREYLDRIQSLGMLEAVKTIL